MTVAEARAIAREWVSDHVAEVPNLWGVQFGGSINWLPDDAPWGPFSDVDVWFQLTGPCPPHLHQRKLLYKGVVVEPAYLPCGWVNDPEKALRDWVVGFHLTTPCVIHDPTGGLTAVQQVVARRYAEPALILERCQGIESHVRTHNLPWLVQGASPEERVIAIAYVGANAIAIPFTASLKPLTIRKGGMLFTEMMAGMGRGDLSELRFQVLGTDRLRSHDVEELFHGAVSAWERAAQVWRTPFYGDFDVQPASRAAMVHGARDLVDRGYHREAASFISIWHYFAHVALRNDAPREYEQTYQRGYDRLREALGLDSVAQVQKKALAAERLLDGLMEVARNIVARTAARS